MIRNYLTITLRNLFKNRVSSLINIGGLAVGMAVAVLMLIWVQNELSFDTYHIKSDRIRQIITHNKVNKEETWIWSTTPMLLAEQLKQLPEAEEVTRTVRPFWNGAPMKIGNKLSIEKKVACVDNNWFNVFDYDLIDGDFTEFGKNLRSIAMTESKAIQLFGDIKVSGKIIKIDTLDYMVRAVFKDNPTNSSFQYDFLMPMAAYLSNPKTFENDSNWGNFNYETFVLVKPNVNLSKLDQKITRILQLARKDPKTGKIEDNVTLLTEPITAIHMDGVDRSNDIPKGDAKTTYIFLALAFIILFTACINYVNLATARASLRAKEVSVKKIIGAEYSQLFIQFMVESVLMCMVALGIALCLVYSLLPFFNELADKHFTLNLTDTTLWLVLLGTTFLAILLTGIYPAILLSSFQPIRALRGFNILKSNNSSFRKTLVVVQFVVSSVFLIATLVVFQQIKFIQNVKLGYEKANMFEFSIPWNIKSKIDINTIKSRLLTESSIESITTASQNIVDIKSTHSGSLDWDGRPEDFQPTVSQLSVEHNYQKVFGLKMAAGHWFGENNLADKENVVLNETAVKKFGIKKPVGKRFHLHGRKGIILGVVRDFHFKSMHEQIGPLVIFSEDNWRGGVYVKPVKGKEKEAITSTEKLWAEFIPSRPLEYHFLNDTYDRLYNTEQRIATLFNAFAIVAIFVSCLGLFGLAAFAAEQRTKEIGVRKVLGASVTSITVLLSSDFLKLVGIAFIVACPLSYYFMNKWLQDFAYHINIEWWFYAIIGVLIIAVAVATVGYQSIKAALTNPVKSLKAE
ncbi:ABC transporter permease [Emticicia sp. BO119]|uniref:ABC transporter permease n=1 Tax=Emticicia sp. BO119 TaxID=2757768 RepID=UPI0015F0E262|nr:ABC transporter permease [Emticicia sp. BO119]MBA4850053.1 ABC transporter permease [Emticicia sp. BO119]